MSDWLSLAGILATVSVAVVALLVNRSMARRQQEHDAEERASDRDHQIDLLHAQLAEEQRVARERFAVALCADVQHNINRFDHDRKLSAADYFQSVIGEFDIPYRTVFEEVGTLEIGNLSSETALVANSYRERLQIFQNLKSTLRQKYRRTTEGPDADKDANVIYEALHLSLFECLVLRSELLAELPSDDVNLSSIARYAADIANLAAVIQRKWPKHEFRPIPEKQENSKT